MHKNAPVLLFLGLYLAVILFFLSNYFLLDVNSCIGLALSPYILICRKNEFSYRYLIPVVLFLGLLFFVPVKSVLFLVLLFSILFLIESNIGKLNSSFLILLFILSPLFHFFNSLIGFPLRLWLSKMAGMMLSFTSKRVDVMGNIISVNGSEFSVDTACTGLKMLTVSFLIALFILAFYQRKSQTPIPFWKVVSFLVFALILNLICNVFRIVLLVYFKLLPTSIFHDIIGILCLALYVMLPLVYLSKLVFEKPISNPKSEHTCKPRMKLNLILHIGLIACMLVAASRMDHFNHQAFSNNTYSIEGYKKEVLKTGIVKFENERALVYIKPLKFYNAEHNPMICWVGSGYEFKQMNKETVFGNLIYTGIIEKGTDKIYTAWWFDNGKYRTINQLDWRLKVVKGTTDFYLINVNATSKKELLHELKQLLNTSTYLKK